MAEERTGIVYSRKLQKPITAHGQQLDEVSFREPTAKDISEIGNPVRFNLFGDVDDIGFREEAMTAMLARLAAVNPGAIDQMTTQDRVSCAWGIAAFFLPAPSAAASG